MNARRICLVVLTVFVIFILVASVATLKLDAAKCTNGKQTCEGECCKVTALDCIAGPCDIVLPQQ